ncbi:hypothetical protein PAXRUDRAFT_832291 [Paxillus rubicundulus Ve08.2h10]|uniref:Uncharacterized protein n=1 Tax=Paxillus rubicundulus Ve08.2h10 TaxID=930991 RepID=A0A0D0DDA9_9AGAM|nr:hypothetical protein PAXRUDRAFT_832291 [Paxillus rubicundulus Ve08.2h10]
MEIEEEERITFSRDNAGRDERTNMLIDEVKMLIKYWRGVWEGLGLRLVARRKADQIGQKREKGSDPKRDLEKTDTRKGQHTLGV